MIRKMMFCLFLGMCFAPAGQADSSNSPLSQYQQAMNYLLGRNGSEKSPQKAAAIFKNLAEHNWKSAQHMLGNLYYKGQGLEKNDLLAYKWLSIASRDNLHLAEAVYQKRKNLQARLSEMHLKQVEQWIENWQPVNQKNRTSTRNEL